MELEKFSDLDTLLSRHNKVIIDCYATWCGPCRMLAPELDKIQNAHPEWKVIKIDIDKFPESAQKFAFHAVPTIIYIVNKEIKDIESGYSPASEIEKIIGKY